MTIDQLLMIQMGFNIAMFVAIVLLARAPRAVRSQEATEQRARRDWRALLIGVLRRKPARSAGAGSTKTPAIAPHLMALIEKTESAPDHAEAQLRRRLEQFRGGSTEPDASEGRVRAS